MTRGVGILGMFMIMIAGTPSTAFAWECEDHLMECLSREECYEHYDDECFLPGECEGNVRCTTGFGCSGDHRYAKVCMVDEVT
jgi:hypothetical protein